MGYDDLARVAQYVAVGNDGVLHEEDATTLGDGLTIDIQAFHYDDAPGDAREYIGGRQRNRRRRSCSKQDCEGACGYASAHECLGRHPASAKTSPSDHIP
ncbi:MAG: hypothetical protein IPI02_03915 [Sterolibacteriaceae bacterium]|nr:hypothetical protein [Sterolibacteriaceae bacterium]